MLDTRVVSIVNSVYRKVALKNILVNYSWITERIECQYYQLKRRYRGSKKNVFVKSNRIEKKRNIDVCRFGDSRCIHSVNKILIITLVTTDTPLQLTPCNCRINLRRSVKERFLRKSICRDFTAHRVVIYLFIYARIFIYIHTLYDEKFVE